MKVDMSDPRVEGLAKHLAMLKLMDMTGTKALNDIVPDILQRAMDKVWAGTTEVDEDKRNMFRSFAVDILTYMDKQKVN